MFDFSDIFELLEERKLVMSWVIRGSGIHGFQIKDIKILNYDYIVEHYNVIDFRNVLNLTTNIYEI